MDNSNYVSLTLARTLERNLDVVSNNIANANTAGFKAERADFQDLVEAHLGAGGRDSVSFVQDAGSHIDPRPGALLKTSNPLDLAISGDGWFGYQTATGQTAYGRDGRFTIDAQGLLATTTGAHVLDAGGAPIAIPAGTGGGLSIAQDGTITDARGASLGQVGLFSVPGIADGQRLGGGLIAPAPGSPPATAAQDVTVSQGFIEQSNVEPVLEMTRMIAIQRAYERAMKLLEQDDSLRQQVLTQLGQAG